MKIKNPEVQTKVVHSRSKAAWNVVGETLGKKYKIARVPYLCTGNEEIGDRERAEAFEHAQFISYCFNNSDKLFTTKSQISDLKSKI